MALLVDNYVRSIRLRKRCVANFMVYDYYHGGKFGFLRFYGVDITGSDSSHVNPLVQQFYNNAAIIAACKDYINHLLTHVKFYTGLTYAESPTVMGYETGTELGGSTFGDIDVPVSWTTEIARYIIELGPNKLVIDGMYAIKEIHLSVEEVYSPVTISR